MSGKGDTPRPMSVSRKEFNRKWLLAFRKCDLCGMSAKIHDEDTNSFYCGPCWIATADDGPEAA